MDTDCFSVMNTTDETRRHLSALATYLGEQRGSLLARWRAATEKAPDATVASTLSRAQFNDHVPGILEALNSRLRAWPSEDGAQQEQEDQQVAGHGLQRWQQGYALRELTREWGHLQTCLMEELEEYAVAHPGLRPVVMATARRALAHLCWDGISGSTTRYWRLHQAEAAGHVRDLEHALDTLNELEQARAAAWREAAHDLRGSVTVVKGAASMLQQENVPEQTRLQFFGLLQKGVSSLHEMLNDLMSLARLEAGQEQRKVASFDAGVLLSDFCTTSLPLAEERGLYLKMEGPPSLEVEGDRAKVLRVLQNLLLNALKYTQSGGVTVIWKASEEHDTQGWMFCVQDTGPGLNAGRGAPIAHELYEATQAAHKAEAEHPNEEMGQTTLAATVAAQSKTLPVSQLPGEGIGLSIVKRLCELLDASLELETSPGQGSTFRVILPRRYNHNRNGMAHDKSAVHNGCIL